MNVLFQVVYALLNWISQVTGFSYTEVNIIVYYIVLPFAYVYLADRIWKKHVQKMIYVVGVAIGLSVIDDFTVWNYRHSMDGSAVLLDLIS